MTTSVLAKKFAIEFSKEESLHDYIIKLLPSESEDPNSEYMKLMNLVVNIILSINNLNLDSDNNIIQEKLEEYVRLCLFLLLGSDTYKRDKGKFVEYYKDKINKLLTYDIEQKIVYIRDTLKLANWEKYINSWKYFQSEFNIKSISDSKAICIDYAKQYIKIQIFKTPSLIKKVINKEEFNDVNYGLLISSIEGDDTCNGITDINYKDLIDQIIRSIKDVGIEALELLENKIITDEDYVKVMYLLDPSGYKQSNVNELFPGKGIKLDKISPILDKLEFGKRRTSKRRSKRLDKRRTGKRCSTKYKKKRRSKRCKNKRRSKKLKSSRISKTSTNNISRKYY